MNVTPRQWFFRGILVLMIVALLVRQYVKYRVAPDLEIASLELVTLDGQPASLSQYQGKNVLLSFFATWCGPCHAEIDDLERLRPELEQHGFALVHVSDEEVAQIEAFKQKNPSGITFYQSISPLDKIGIHTFPIHYVLSKAGETKLKQTNALDWDNPEIVQKLVEAAEK